MAHAVRAESDIQPLRKDAPLTSWYRLLFVRKSLRGLFVAVLISVVTVLQQLLLQSYAAGAASNAHSEANNYRSSAIAISRDGTLLIAVNPDSNTVSLVDIADNNSVAELVVGRRPLSVALSKDGLTAYVANHSSHTVSVVDTEAAEVLHEIPVGFRPLGVALSPDSPLLVVAEFGDDQIRWIDTRSLETVSVTPVADRPYALAFSTTNSRLLVTHLLSGTVTLLDSPPIVVFMPALTSHVFSGLHPQSGDAAAGLTTQIHTWPNVAPAPGIVVSSTGDRAYLPQTMANGLGMNIRFDTTVFPKVSVIDPETAVHVSSEHISLPEVDRPVGLPWDVALAKGGKELWIVNAGSNNVSVVSLSDASRPARIANIPVGSNPRGITVSPDGNYAYVNNTLSGDISVLDARTYTVSETIISTKIPLPPALLHGKRLYHSSARPDLARASWIGCNTCHIEGEHDGRTWELIYTGDVPNGEDSIVRRNTTSLLGMVETYPLRWSAEWDESADSEHSVRFEQFGDGLISGDLNETLGPPNRGRSFDLDSLALYIDSLKAPERTKQLDAAALRGKVLFESADTECSACHPAPLYTDLRVHDVGTAEGPREWFGPAIDTPTLRFLYDSAPYLHDGSAATLRAVLTNLNPSDRHGRTSQLTEKQIADLIAFLQSLPH